MRKKKIKLGGENNEEEINVCCCRYRNQDQRREWEAEDKSVINSEHKLHLMYCLALRGN